LIGLRHDTRELHAAPANRQSESQVSSPEDEQLAEASARLDQWLEQISDAIPKIDVEAAGRGGESGTDLWGGNDPSTRAVHCVTAGELDLLVLDGSPSPLSRQLLPWFAVAAVAGVCGICLWFVRQPIACDFIYRWPHAVAFVAGAGYWAWLRPSWLGMLIAAGSLFLAVRSGWPGRAIRMEGSTVVRAGRGM
jgi:hypothetical protein